MPQPTDTLLHDIKELQDINQRALSEIFKCEHPETQLHLIKEFIVLEDNS